MELFKVLCVGRGNKLGGTEVLLPFTALQAPSDSSVAVPQRLVHLLSTAGCSAEVPKLAEND